MSILTWTRGSLLFYGGVGGMALVIIAAIIVAVCLKRSEKKIKKRLETFYRDTGGH